MAKRILLAEDEPHIVESLTFVLRRAGFQVSPATDGRAALVALNERAPDLLILDVMMPELDGFEVLRALGARAVRPPVIVLTAKGQHKDRDRALEAGADLFISKPFCNADVVAAARRLTDAPGASDGLRSGDERADHDARRA